MRYSIEIKLVGTEEWIDYIPTQSNKEQVIAVAAILRANTAIADVKIVTWYREDEIALAVPDEAEEAE